VRHFSAKGQQIVIVEKGYDGRTLSSRRRTAQNTRLTLESSLNTRMRDAVGGSWSVRRLLDTLSCGSNFRTSHGSSLWVSGPFETVFNLACWLLEARERRARRGRGEGVKYVRWAPHLICI